VDPQSRVHGADCRADGHSPSRSSAIALSLLSSAKPLYVLARWVFCLAAIIAGLNTIRLAIVSLGVEHVHRKDFLQEYLLGRALLDGTNPYLPLPELAAKYLGPLPDPVFPHPTPHPPPVALLSVVLTPFEYPVAAGVWLGIEVLCTTAAFWIIQKRTAPELAAPMLAVTIVVFLGTDAFFYELVLGQLQTVVLLLLVVAWAALRRGQDWAGGAALGAALALKLMGWPIVLLLLMKRRWRAVASSVTVVAASYVAAALAMGLGPIVDYYTRVGPYIASIYRGDTYNTSLWSVGWRIFAGTSPTVFVGPSIPPLVRWEVGAQLLGIGMPLVCVGLTLAAAARSHSFDAAYAMLCCTSALVSPISWTHYVVLAAIAVFWAWRSLHALGFPRRETHAAIAISLLLHVRNGQVHAAALRLLEANGRIGILFAASLITLLPAAALVGLTWLVWRVDRMGMPQVALK